MTRTHENSSEDSKRQPGRLGAFLNKLGPVAIETTGSTRQLDRVKDELRAIPSRRGEVYSHNPMVANLNRAGSIAWYDDARGRHSLTHVILAGESAFGIVTYAHSTGRHDNIIGAQLVLLPLGAHQEDTLGHHRTPRQLLGNWSFMPRTTNKTLGATVGSRTVSGDPTLSDRQFNVYMSDGAVMSVASAEGSDNPTYVLDHSAFKEINAGGSSSAMDLAALMQADSDVWQPRLVGHDLNR